MWSQHIIDAPLELSLKTCFQQKQYIRFGRFYSSLENTNKTITTGGTFRLVMCFCSREQFEPTDSTAEMPVTLYGSNEIS